MKVNNNVANSYKAYYYWYNNTGLFVCNRIMLLN